jgi:hypothetical protein
VGTSIALSGSNSNTGGASSPAGAVTALLTAADHSDVIGALDTVAPGERAALEPGLQNIVSQLKRLNVLSSTADLNDVAGVSLQFKGIGTRTDYLNSDIAAVSLTSGKVTSSAVPSQLPLGSFVKDLAGTRLGGPSKTQTTPVATTTCGQTAAQIATCNPVIGTVKVDGSWYVSIGYSIAINALKDDSKSEAPPAASQAIQAVGAATPQGAVQEVFNSISNLDPESLIADMAPDEVAAADTYAPDWLSRAETEINSVKGKVTIKFGNLDLSTQPLGDGTMVKVGSAMTFDIKADGYDVSYANSCLTVTRAGAHLPICLDEVRQLLTSNLPPALVPIFQRLMSSNATTGFVTVQENGRWFVSPTRTSLQSMAGVLSVFQPQDLQTIANNASTLKNTWQKVIQKEIQSLGGGNATISAQSGLILPS